MDEQSSELLAARRSCHDEGAGMGFLFDPGSDGPMKSVAVRIFRSPTKPQMFEVQLLSSHGGPEMRALIAPEELRFALEADPEVLQVAT